MRRLLLLFLISVFFFACSNDTPKGIIDKRTMVPLLTDLHLTNAFSYSYVADTLKDSVGATYKAFYKKYGTDSVGVRKSLAYYIKRPEELELIYKEVEINLERYEKAEQKRLARVEAQLARKRKILADIKKAKAKVASDRKKMLKGKYDFGLSTYKSPIETYLKLWRKPVKAKKGGSKVKKDTLKTKIEPLKAGEIKKKLLLKKPERKNDLSPKRLR